MPGKPSNQRDTGSFWSWLRANASRIQAVDREEAEDMAEALAVAFEASYPDLVWEITSGDSGPWTFCVSADGDPELFDAVRSAVADAPAIPGWEVKAFRQRGSLEAVIELHGRTLGYDDIWCDVEADGDRRASCCWCADSPQSRPTI